MFQLARIVRTLAMLFFSHIVVSHKRNGMLKVVSASVLLVLLSMPANAQEPIDTLTLTPNAASTLTERSLRLESLKRTEYQQELSPYQREHRYLGLDEAASLDFVTSSLSFIAERPSSDDNEKAAKLRYNELSIAFGAQNTIVVEAALYNYFSNNLLAFQLATRHAKALSQLTTGGIHAIPNSEVTELFLEQIISLADNRHTLQLKHQSTISGLQDFTLSTANTESPATNLRQSLFQTTFRYHFNIPLPSTQVSELLLSGASTLYYGSQFLRGQTDDVMRNMHYFEDNFQLALSFNKNIQHAFTTKLALDLGSFIGETRLEFLLSPVFTYEFQHSAFTLQLGIRAAYRLENTEGSQRHSINPILPQMTFTVPLSSNVQLHFGIDGIAERTAGEYFYIEHHPLPFAENVFPIVNRYFSNFFSLAVRYQTLLHWELSGGHRLYLSDIEHLALTSEQLAVLHIIPASLSAPYHSAKLLNKLRISILPFFTFAHTLQYTFLDADKLHPVLAMTTEFKLKENILHSHLTVTYRYRYRDYFAVLDDSAAQTVTEYISRERNALDLRYTIQLLKQELQSISLFISIDNLITDENYRNIPYLSDTLRLLKLGLEYVF